MTTIGLIGAGQIGSQLARLALAHGYDVVISVPTLPPTVVLLLGVTLIGLGWWRLARRSTAFGG